MEQARASVYRFGEFGADAAGRRLTRAGEAIPLTSKAFDALVFLVERAGETVSKDDLLAAVWHDTVVEENDLTQCTSALRRALGEKPGENRYIATVPGAGYRFVADVEVEPGRSESDRAAAANGSRIVRRGAIAIVSVLAVALLIAWGFSSYRGGTDNASAPSGTVTIGVLPFKPLIPETRNEAVEMGMADALITKLGASPNIVVRQLSSVRRFARPEQDPIAAGRDLGVETVLDGTVQESNGRIRVTARLLRTADGRQLWADTFEDAFTDVFAVQDSMSARVLSALSLKLSDDARGRVARRHTSDVEAYQDYMQGRLHASRLVLPETRKALEYYENAVRIDANYALAYVGIAQANLAFTLSGDQPANEVMPRAELAAKRALEIAPDLPESIVAMGLVEFWYKWRWGDAESMYKKALAIEPNNPFALHFYAHLVSNIGRHEEAVANIRKARASQSRFRCSPTRSRGKSYISPVGRTKASAGCDEHWSSNRTSGLHTSHWRASTRIGVSSTMLWPRRTGRFNCHLGTR